MKLLLLIVLLLPGAVEAADKDTVLKVMICESGLRSDVWGDDGNSYGIAQFRKETFYEFAVLARKEMRKAGIYRPNWHNPQHQVFLLNWGIDNGYGPRWTCYRNLKRGTAGPAKG